MRGPQLEAELKFTLKLSIWRICKFFVTAGQVVGWLVANQLMRETELTFSSQPGGSNMYKPSHLNPSGSKEELGKST